MHALVMPTMTIKKFPEPLLARLREKAAASRRSVTQEVLARLEASLHQNEGEHNSTSYREAERQADSWSAIGGKWRAKLTVQEEIRQLYKARTRGRTVKL